MITICPACHQNVPIGSRTGKILSHSRVKMGFAVTCVGTGMLPKKGG